jgi:predicted kinase
MNTSAKLIFLCGKMAAGKSTLARDLAKRENAILLAPKEALTTIDRSFGSRLSNNPS